MAKKPQTPTKGMPPKGMGAMKQPPFPPKTKKKK